MTISTLPDPPCSVPLSGYPDRGFVIPSQAYSFPHCTHDSAWSPIDPMYCKTQAEYRLSYPPKSCPLITTCHLISSA